MKTSRIISIIFAFAVTEPALAFCPNPYVPGVYCCDFNDTVTVPPSFGPTGLLTASGKTFSMISSDEQAYSLQGCRDDARLKFNLLAYAAHCPSLPELPPVTEIYSTISVPDGLGGSSGTQNYGTRFHAYTGYRNPDGSPAIGICLDFRGITSWVVPPPSSPPPPPPVACLIPDMPVIMSTDTCTTSLEANNGLPGPTGNCPSVSVMVRTLGEPCFKGKVGTIGVAYNGPTSTLRTVYYNLHLQNVWDWYWKHQWLITDPVQYEACTAKRAAVEAEMTKHGLVYRPSLQSRHLVGRAFDVSKTVINGIKHARVQRLLNSPTACTLSWGGKYEDPDYVHFELNVP